MDTNTKPNTECKQFDDLQVLDIRRLDRAALQQPDHVPRPLLLLQGHKAAKQVGPTALSRHRKNLMAFNYPMGMIVQSSSFTIST